MNFLKDKADWQVSLNQHTVTIHINKVFNSVPSITDIHAYNLNMKSERKANVVVVVFLLQIKWCLLRREGMGVGGFKEYIFGLER